MDKLIKLKFFRFQKSFDINILIDAINKCQYSETNPIGFDINTYDNNSIMARFIEKIKVKEVIINPYGDIEEIELIKYNSFEFEILILKEINYLKVYDFPRSMKKFIEYFSKALSQNLSLNIIKLNINEFYHFINKSTDINRFNVTQINVSAIPLSEKSNAKMEIISIDDAYEEFKNNTNYVNYSIEKIKFKIRYQNQSVTANISSSGSIEISDILENFIENYILIQEN